MLPGLIDGALPTGRWTCRPEDLNSVHMLPDSTHRAAIWREWTELTGAVQEATGAVAACWLGGSYFTDKAEPADIDCVYVIDHERLSAARAGTSHAQLLDIVAKSQVKDVFELRIDSFVLSWWPRGGVHRGSDVRRESYLETRGYWDDLWLRKRSTGARESKIPSRGYVEVILDGYT